MTTSLGGRLKYPSAISGTARQLLQHSIRYHTLTPSSPRPSKNTGPTTGSRKLVPTSRWQKRTTACERRIKRNLSSINNKRATEKKKPSRAQRGHWLPCLHPGMLELSVHFPFLLFFFYLALFCSLRSFVSFPCLNRAETKIGKTLDWNKNGERKRKGRPTKKLLPASQPSSGFKAWTAEADKGRPPSQQFLQILLLLNFCWTFDRYFFLFAPVPSIRFCSAFGVSVTTPFFFPSFFFLSQSLSIYGSPLSIKRRGVQVARVSESEISVSASSQTNYVKK